MKLIPKPALTLCCQQYATKPPYNLQVHAHYQRLQYSNVSDKKSYLQSSNINGRDVQRKNVVNNVDKSSLWAP